jgi:hypothetical protein
MGIFQSASVEGEALTANVTRNNLLFHNIKNHDCDLSMDLNLELNVHQFTTRSSRALSLFIFSQ